MLGPFNDGLSPLAASPLLRPPGLSLVPVLRRRPAVREKSSRSSAGAAFFGVREEARLAVVVDVVVIAWGVSFHTLVGKVRVSRVNERERE